MRDWGAFLVEGPPFMEGLIRSDVKPLLRWRSLSEGIGHIRTKYKKIFSSRDAIEQTSAGLVNTICISLIEDTNLSRTWRPVASTSSFLTGVKSLNAI
jgi:hypothetical protein